MLKFINFRQRLNDIWQFFTGHTDRHPRNQISTHPSKPPSSQHTESLHLHLTHLQEDCSKDLKHTKTWKHADTYFHTHKTIPRALFPSTMILDIQIHLTLSLSLFFFLCLCLSFSARPFFSLSLPPFSLEGNFLWNFRKIQFMKCFWNIFCSKKFKPLTCYTIKKGKILLRKLQKAAILKHYYYFSIISALAKWSLSLSLDSKVHGSYLSVVFKCPRLQH